MAHELNQPLTAVLANTQAASRLLNEDEPDLDTARLAMKQAVDQARRASDVLGRLRRSVERERNAPLAEAPINAQSASNKVGTANIAAAQQMMGNAYGVSAVPQRPHPSFTSPLIPAPH
jgi:C4-dicarboxylate-specific signal transduction histidine kinase